MATRTAKTKSKTTKTAKTARSKGPKKHLVIVESPAKARTLAGILGSGYDIRASVGHVRDLPKTRLGVEVDQGFEPRYVVPKEKRDVVKEIKAAAGRADQVYLATDPDREGEAISWHLVEAAELGDRPHQRVVFHELTPEAVREAFAHPRAIDHHLVDAQQARRVLDRLVGYKVSPILWKKIRRGLSAGRVQSVALRMVAEREREIQAFVPQEYWTIDAEMAKESSERSFSARYVGLAGKKKAEIPNQEEAGRLVDLLTSASHAVSDLKQRPQTRRPGPPFTTSTLQQDASRRFGFTAKRTMAVAQQLYEGIGGDVGLITYMRTDSTNIAASAKAEARDYIGNRFGKEFVPEQARAYKTRGKRAQEAHEAIRPTSVERDPTSLRNVLNRDQQRLYTLIWQRFVACQMADALFDLTTIEIESTPADGSDTHLLRASESVLRFTGYRQLYEEMRDDDVGDEEPEAHGLPQVAPGDPLTIGAVRPEQHFTEPPPRFTEASLVKALEENGIGRPSTYAPILSTIQDRGYVAKDGRALVPQQLGFVVNDLLVEHFPDTFNVGFTAEMEEELDEVADGDRPWAPVVRQFYDPLEAALESAASAPRVEEATDEVCPKCGKPMVARWGRFGRFLACTGYPECRTTKPLDEEGEPETSDEKCDVCGADMVPRGGRYGRFLACTRYPDCKGTKPILKKTGVTCPKDGGELVERRTKKGRTFYGCANYPKCDFTTWTRPLPEPCPNCGKLLVAAGRARNDGRASAKCSECDWKGEVGAPEMATVATA